MLSTKGKGFRNILHIHDNFVCRTGFLLIFKFKSFIHILPIHVL